MSPILSVAGRPFTTGCLSGMDPRGGGGPSRGSLRGFRSRSLDAIGDDGTIYVPTEDGTVRALRPDGVETWRVELGEQISSPVVDGAGTVYVASEEGSMYAIESGDTDKGPFETDGAIQSAPVIGGDGPCRLEGIPACVDHSPPEGQGDVESPLRQKAPDCLFVSDSFDRRSPGRADLVFQRRNDGLGQLIQATLEV